MKYKVLLNVEEIMECNDQENLILGRDLLKLRPSRAQGNKRMLCTVELALLLYFTM